MRLILIVISALAYVGLHEFNAWVFDFLSFNAHISYVYLPALIRLLNVLVLGPLNGTLATMLGGLLILPFGADFQLIELANILCSASGPLIALVIFKYSFNSEIRLSSIKDLFILSWIYALANALIHHITWCLLDPSALIEPKQFFEMVIGDINGALMGSMALKLLVKLPFIEKKIDSISKP